MGAGPAGPRPPLDPGALDPEAFLATYWQRHPCLIRNWLTPPPQPLPMEQLSKLAGQEELGARLVSGCLEERNWNVDYGPFDSDKLRGLPPSNWTVLVQDVDKVVPSVAKLLQSFAFLPRLMLDDIMISQAAPGGSVGPHVDRYDVFLVQTRGTRRWQLARDFPPDNDPGFELAILARFSAEQTLDVHPGDILYLPPGVAHHGVALNKCQTWSVGIRAPSGIELLEALPGWLMDRSPGETAALPAASDSPLDQSLVAACMDRIHRLLPTEPTDQARFVGEALTGYRFWPPEQRDDAISSHDGPLRIDQRAKCAWIREGDRERLFVNGESTRCARGLAARVQTREPWTATELSSIADMDQARRLIEWLDEAGVLVAAPETDRD